MLTESKMNFIFIGLQIADMFGIFDVLIIICWCN